MEVFSPPKSLTQQIFGELPEPRRRILTVMASWIWLSPMVAAQIADLPAVLCTAMAMVHLRPVRKLERTDHQRRPWWLLIFSASVVQPRPSQIAVAIFSIAPLARW